MLVIHGRSRVSQRLPDIFRLEEWMLGEKYSPIRISRKQLQKSANGDPHTPNAGLARAFAGLDRNAIKGFDRCHMASLEERGDSCYHSHGMVKTTVYLDEKTVAALKGISKRSAKPQAQLIRDALRVFTTTGNPPPLPSGMGMFDSGRTNTTTRRKELLRQAARSRRWRS